MAGRRASVARMCAGLAPVLGRNLCVRNRARGRRESAGRRIMGASANRPGEGNPVDWDIAKASPGRSNRLLDTGARLLRRRRRRDGAPKIAPWSRDGYCKCALRERARQVRCRQPRLGKLVADDRVAWAVVRRLDCIKGVAGWLTGRLCTATKAIGTSLNWSARHTFSPGIVARHGL